MSLPSTSVVTLVLPLILAGCLRQPTVVPYSAPVPALAGRPDNGSAAPSADLAYLLARRLVMPVAGVDIRKVRDSFNAARAGGRVHDAIDILAPRGSPVLAADDGRVLRLGSNALGGITIYEIDSAGRMVYYYAHLERYREGLAVGMPLAKGDTIGYVGTTGDAPANVPHLHFQIRRMPADGKYWTGEPIDPWPALAGLP